MIGMFSIDQQRHLVRAKRPLNLQTINDFRPRPSLWRRRTIIGQRGRVLSLFSRALLWISRMSSMTLSKVAAMS